MAKYIVSFCDKINGKEGFQIRYVDDDELSTLFHFYPYIDGLSGYRCVPVSSLDLIRYLIEHGENVIFK